MIIYPLILGSVSFAENAQFESPNGLQGGLSDLGSEQRARVFEFPGGIISGQLYGSFPKLIEWSGILFGGNAFARSQQLQQLCDNGDFITFSYAQWNYQGFVKSYSATVKAFNIVEYKIVFRPLVNNSTVSGGNNFANNNPSAGAVSNAQNTMTQQAQSPASGATLPSAVVSGTTSLNNAINQGIQQAGGSFINLPVSSLTSLLNQVSALQSLLAPLIIGNNPATASAAGDLSATLSTLTTAFSSSVNPLITTINVSNPNIYQLAARYYGNPALYQLITDANGLPPDPLPITNGVISLKIPVEPANAAA